MSEAAEMQAACCWLLYVLLPDCTTCGMCLQLSSTSCVAAAGAVGGCAACAQYTEVTTTQFPRWLG
jgi:hypothetical protein